MHDPVPEAAQSRAIACLGGSFDPPHIAHLEIARAVREELGLDRVLFLPAVRNPFKSEGPQASFAQRRRMLEALSDGIPWIEVNTIEKELGNPSRSLRTVQALRGLFPAARIFWIIGADNLPGLGKWFGIEELAQLVTFVVLERPGCPVPEKPALSFGLRLHRVKGPRLPISSTDVRKRLQSGQDVRNLLGEHVFRIIQSESLYTSSSQA